MWVMGEWAVGQWIVGVTSFQKIYALYSVKHQKVEKWSYYASCGWILWVGWVCVGDVWQSIHEHGAVWIAVLELSIHCSKYTVQEPNWKI